MKFRMIALLLVLVLALTACSSTAELTKSGKEPKNIRRSENETAASLPTIQPPSKDWTDVDIGSIDGNTYKNVALGASCEFPDDWYIYNETDIASLNNLAEAAFDHAAVADAVESDQTVTLFCASQPVDLSSVKICVSKNPLPDADEAAIIEASAAAVEAQWTQNAMENVTAVVGEAEFCGQKHSVLAVSGDSAGLTLYDTILYIADGEYLYTLTVSCSQEGAAADILNYFTAIG